MDQGPIGQARIGIKITDGRRTQRTQHMLVIVGDHFVYARNRAHDLPNAKSLTETGNGVRERFPILDASVPLVQNSVKGSTT